MNQCNKCKKEVLDSYRIGDEKVCHCPERQPDGSWKEMNQTSESNRCPNHPEGGKTHNYAFCFCDMNYAKDKISSLKGEVEALRECEKSFGMTWEKWSGAIISQRQQLTDLQKENEALRSEAKLGNVPYKEAIRIKQENADLQKENERLKEFCDNNGDNVAQGVLALSSANSDLQATILGLKGALKKIISLHRDIKTTDDEYYGISNLATHSIKIIADEALASTTPTRLEEELGKVSECLKYVQLVAELDNHMDEKGFTLMKESITTLNHILGEKR